MEDLGGGSINIFYNKAKNVGTIYAAGGAGGNVQTYGWTNARNMGILNRRSRRSRKRYNY